MAERKLVTPTKIFAMQNEAVQQRKDTDRGTGRYIASSFQGGSRSGKTYNLMIWHIMYAMSNSGTRVSIVRKSRPTLERSVVQDFKDIMYKMEAWRSSDWNATKLIYSFANGSVIEFFALDGADGEQKARGSKRDLLWCNEANEVMWDIFAQLVQRTSIWVTLDYNPSFSDDHWLCEYNRRKDVYFKITTYKDNPFLESTIVNWIEGYRETNKSLWQIYGLGLQCQVEGLVYPHYDVVTRMPAWVTKRYVGVDFGFQNDPTAIILVGIYRDELYVDELCYATKMLNKDIARVLTDKKAKGYPIIVDNAEPKTVAELTNMGVKGIVRVKKGGRNGAAVMQAGIQSVQSKHIFVTEPSGNVEKELRNYTYRQTGEDSWSNQPIDKFNHAMDALRYVVYTKALGVRRSGIRYSR